MNVEKATELYIAARDAGVKSAVLENAKHFIAQAHADQLSADMLETVEADSPRAAKRPREEPIELSDDDDDDSLQSSQQEVEEDSSNGGAMGGDSGASANAAATDEVPVGSVTVCRTIVRELRQMIDAELELGGTERRSQGSGAPTRSRTRVYTIRPSV